MRRSLFVFLIMAATLQLAATTGPGHEAHESDSWIARASIPTQRSFTGAAMGANGRLYVVGGYGGPYGSRLYQVEEYDPLTDTWFARADLPTPRYDLGLVTGRDGLVYAIGGNTMGGIGWTVQAYDPESDAWQWRTHMPTSREGLCVASAGNGKIYAFGGGNAVHPYLATVEDGAAVHI